jgi:DNA-binding CsgD family transcriptional regulator
MHCMERNVQILSDREQQILYLLADGQPEISISNHLLITEEAVKEDIRNMLLKQGFVSTYQLINWAYREAIIS